jgi:glutaredoxin
MSHVRPFVAAGLIGLAAATLFSPLAGAQQVYRIVGPDGKVTFSDKAPLDANAKQAPLVTSGSTSGGNAGLPFELRQVADKYPVTLYTSTDCGPCGSGRAYLSSRGIPFTEKTITTSEDAEALKRMAGVNSLPLLTIGSQQLKGYSDTEWGQYLGAAGYPAKASLPATWRNPEPSPMVAVQRRAPQPTDVGADTGKEAARAPAQPQRPAANNNNPAGIRF